MNQGANLVLYCGGKIGTIRVFREPLKIHFGGQTNLFVAEQCQATAALSTDKADLSSLSANKNFLLAAQKQLLELPLIFRSLNHYESTFVSAGYNG